MLLPRLAGGLLLAISSAHAYKNASPFFVLSSDPLKDDAPLKRAQIALASDIDKRLTDTFEACDQQRYYVFHQANVAAEDLRYDRMPQLQKRLEGVAEAQFVGIPDVVDDAEGSRSEDISSRLRRACTKKGKKEAESWPTSDREFRIESVELPEMPTEEKARTQVMLDTDASIIDTVNSVLAKDSSAVLIYLSTPLTEAEPNAQDGLPYEMEDTSPLHTDLKRDLSHHARASDDDNMQAGLPLFEKYQFFTPPLFMGLSVSILLLAILYVGLRAISGLEVSYMAFSKEMGPQAQKGKQQ